MVDYSSWKRKKISVNSLRLDILNPRLSGFGKNTPKQSEIIDYLISHEKIAELAKDISILGFLPNEEPIVYKEHEKYVVLEGNRRVAACKVLLNPNMIPNTSSKKRQIAKISDITDAKSIKSLTVIIAPNRIAADVLIVNRHTQGTPIEKWDKTKQDRFFSLRHKDGESIDEMAEKFNLSKSAVKSSLTRFNFFEEMLELDMTKEQKAAMEDETKLNLTTIERFYQSKLGREFLGVEIKIDGGIRHLLPRNEYQARLKTIATEVISRKLNSRNYGNETQQKEYINKISKNQGFDFSIVPSKSYEKEYQHENSNSGIVDTGENHIIQDTKGSTTVLNTEAGAYKLVPAAAKNWRSENIRINKVFKELKDANLKTQFNSTAILFRSYLDMVIYQFLKKHDAIANLLMEEQKRISIENDKKKKGVIELIKSFGLNEDEIDLKKLEKALLVKRGVSPDWIPSLKQMLSYIVSSKDLITDSRLKQALTAYIKGNEEFLGHNDLNLLVHNEYYLKSDPKQLKDTWNQLFPILKYFYESSI